MSSTGSYSDTKEPKRLGEFIFTWSIHNYSYVKKVYEQPLESPQFVVDFLGDEKLKLQLYTESRDLPGFISIYLWGIYYWGNPQMAACNFRFSIRKTNGQFQDKGKPDICDFCPIGHHKFVSLEKLKEIDGGYLVDDTLTLRCRIWKNDVDIPASVKYNAHSTIRISKLDYTWILNDVEVSNNALIISNQNKEITDCFVKIPSLKIQLLNGHSEEDSIHFGIEMGERTKAFYFFICRIRLLDKNGQVAHSARGEHCFEHSKPKENWSFPIISIDKLYVNKNVYLHEGKLTLRCELGFSTDDELQTFEYQGTYVSEKSDLLDQDPGGPLELWVENMSRCFLDGKFSDFIIRTPEKKFPVHKAILSAHSEVFEAMFEMDMKESNSGVVEIDDLDDDTISQMLTFLYTNKIEDLNCTSAQKLFFAADKYRIKPLHKKCSNYLMCGLDALNVCDILDLADRHQDQELKSRARDFIENHAREIIVSDGWKKLLETNPHLTSEIFQAMFCKKFLCNEE